MLKWMTECEEIFNYVSKKNFDYTVLQDSLLFSVFNTLILKDA